MLSILNSIELSSEYLEKKGISDARINAELLLAHVLNCKRMELYLRFDQPLKDEEINNYRELIRRRGLREPYQYIVGFVEFYGNEFLVNKSALIPRPETELLVEAVIKDYNKEESNILEVGTGSGNIAITLALNMENAKIHSIDISNEAIELAELNASKFKLNGRLNFENVSIEKFNTKLNNNFDFVVSNPPYISLKDYGNLEEELINYEPEIALTDGKNGLYFYELISNDSFNLLNVGGKIFLEIGHGQSRAVTEFMRSAGFSNIQYIKDFQNIDRVIIGEKV